jgi:hypothetical protein
MATQRFGKCLGMQLLTYLHDPDDLYIPLINSWTHKKDLRSVTVAISPNTTGKVKKLVAELGFKTIEGGDYGIARLNLIKHALEQNNITNLLLCDFDKLVHWTNTNAAEFNELNSSDPKSDLIVIARSAKALASYPETWRQTENIATKILAKIIKQQIDFMNGPIILNKKSAQIISEKSQEQGVGSCAEFCLLAYHAGLSIENIEVEGLTWEDPDRYKKMIENYSSYDDWKYETYDSLYEWRKRVDFLNTQVRVMIRLAQEPINPKYPMVHNKTLELV